MQLQQVRYVLEAARLLNFTQAAKRCGVSQPALTKAVRALEDELGGALFHREPTMVLSELGRRMLPLLQETYAAAEAVRRQADSFRKRDVAPLAIGVCPTLQLARLTPHLSEVQRTLPGLELRVEQADGDALQASLQAGTLDLVLAAVAPEDTEVPDGLHRLAIGQESFRALCPPDHPWSNQEKIAAEDAATAADRIALCPTFEASLMAPIAARHTAATPTAAAVMVDCGLGWVACPDDSVATPQPIIDGIDRTLVALWSAGRPHGAAAGMLVRILRMRQTVSPQGRA
jgi:DNA-binding transcriptional LysR family regulator